MLKDDFRFHTILMTIGELTFTRQYYSKKADCEYHYWLDKYMKTRTNA